MRVLTLCIGAALAAGQSAAFAATPGYITSVVAGTPDPNSKVPAFNAVPGAGTGTFSEAVPQAILDHGNSYVVCITMQNAGGTATATWSYKITQKVGSTKGTILKGTVARNVSLSGNGLYAYCTTAAAIPNSPGTATLTGSIAFATDPKATIALSVPVLLN